MTYEKYELEMHLALLKDTKIEEVQEISMKAYYLSKETVVTKWQKAFFLPVEWIFIKTVSQH